MTSSAFSTAFGDAFDSLYEEGILQMAPKTGHGCKLYYNSGIIATPVWEEVDEVGDVSLSGFELAMAELKRRACDFAKNLAGTFGSFTIEFTMPHGLDSTLFTALRTFFLAKTPNEWLIADGDSGTAGTEGLRCPMLISAFNWDQPLDDASAHGITLTVAYMTEGSTEIDPSWFIAT